MHLDLGFLKFLGNLEFFVFLLKILGWALLICFQMLMHCILKHYNHVFMHSRFCACLKLMSVVVWIGFLPMMQLLLHVIWLCISMHQFFFFFFSSSF